MEPFKIPANPRHRENASTQPLTSAFHRPLVEAHGKEWGAEAKTCLLGLPRSESEGPVHLLSGLCEHRLMVYWLQVRGRQESCSDHRFFFGIKKRHQHLGDVRKHLRLHPSPCFVVRQRLADSGRGWEFCHWTPTCPDTRQNPILLILKLVLLVFFFEIEGVLLLIFLRKST